MTTRPREATAAELADWDHRAVRAPGGHVYQSTVWADQRARLGWSPVFVMLDDDHPALVLTRPFPVVGGSSAYVPRGPIVDPDDPTDGGEAAAERVNALANWLVERRVAVVATDAEVPAADVAYGSSMRRAGFHPIPEIQPSRHRVSLALAQGTDDEAVRATFGKSTRQRISGAERDDVVVERHDRGGWQGMDGLFERPRRQADEALDAFATLLEGTGERRGFRFGPRDVFIDWWRAALDAGMLVFLDARDGGEDSGDGRSLGGLILYRHGSRLSTVHSGDPPGVRESHPGVMHLLRWRAIQLAIREGCDEMDLGGVDTGPEHEEPGEGHPMAGLYEHKRSFGASWVAMTGAHERVMRPSRYALGRVAARLDRLVGR
ncbi:MAG TPA: GNAT family N-acetyltransferase [Candidatus Limnocylindrales bacterium]|nr:GNAT family N-acetyltransferase [Candidatus Limnocylindrales bacterium]